MNLVLTSNNSRQAIKKYVQANNKIPAQGASFDAQFNKAIKSGVDKGDFLQPKGMKYPQTGQDPMKVPALTRLQVPLAR